MRTTTKHKRPRSFASGVLLLLACLVFVQSAFRDLAATIAGIFLTGVWNAWEKVGGAAEMPEEEAVLQTAEKYGGVGDHHGKEVFARSSEGDDIDNDSVLRALDKLAEEFGAESAHLHSNEPSDLAHRGQDEHQQEVNKGEQRSGTATAGIQHVPLRDMKAPRPL